MSYNTAFKYHKRIETDNKYYQWNRIKNDKRYEERKAIAEDLGFRAPSMTQRINDNLTTQVMNTMGPIPARVLQETRKRKFTEGDRHILYKDALNYGRLPMKHTQPPWTPPAYQAAPPARAPGVNANGLPNVGGVGGGPTASDPAASAPQSVTDRDIDGTSAGC